MNNVSIDIETLGNSAGCVILSIGAWRFDPESDTIDPNYFYTTIDPESCVKAGLTMNVSTVMWWMQQSDSARKSLIGAKATLNEALDGFASWLPKNAIVWGNGSDFDNVIVSSAYKAMSKEQPWPFWGNRCLRTLKNLYPQITVSNVGTAHNALDDALYQAKLCQAIYKEIMK